MTLIDKRSSPQALSALLNVIVHTIGPPREDRVFWALAFGKRLAILQYLKHIGRLTLRNIYLH